MTDLNRPAGPDAMLETSASTAALDEALAKCQGEIENAIKDKINPAFRSKYADIASVWDACRPALAKYGLALSQWPLSSSDNRLHIVTRLAHKGEYMQARFSIPVSKNDAHGYGSAITYTKRFTLSACLGIAADDSDDDGNGASGKGPGSVPKVDPADQALVRNGDNRSTYQQKHAGKPPGRLAAELWASQAIGLFKMPDYNLLHYREWKETPCTPGGRKNNGDKLDELREKHPDLAQAIDDVVADLKPAVLQGAA